ncbi:MFS transporter, partial [Anaeromyxobacter sp. SG66]
MPSRPLPPQAPRPPGPVAALLSLALAGICAFLNVYATQPLLPLLGVAFGVSKAAAALTVSAPPIAIALASPFVGALAERVGRRRLIVGSLFALSVPTLLAATAPGMRSLLAWRFAQGLAVPGVYAVSISYVAAEWAEGGLARGMAIVVSGNVVGGFLGRVVAALVAERAGWRAAFVALGAITLAGALAVARGLPPERRPAPRRGPPLAALRALAGR